MSCACGWCAGRVRVGERPEGRRLGLNFLELCVYAVGFAVGIAFFLLTILLIFINIIIYLVGLG